MTLKIDTLRKNVVFVLLFLAAMNFQAKFFYFVFASALAVAIFQRRIRVDVTTIMYFALGVLMAIYNAEEGVQSVIKCFAPCCFYLVGLNITTEGIVDLFDTKETVKAEKINYSVLAVVSMGSFAHFAINYVYNLGQNIGRNTNDIWTGTTMAATGQIALACFMTGFSLAEIIYPAKRWRRWAAVSALLIILLYNFMLAGRTILIIAAVLAVIGVIYFVIKIDRKQIKSHTFVSICVAVFALVVIYSLDIGRIQSIVQGSELVKRFSKIQGNVFDNSQRNNARIMFVTHMLEYPFGGLHLRSSYGYAHDLLLDGYDEYGLIGLFLLIAIAICGIVNLIRVVRKTPCGEHYKITLLLVNIAVLLEFTVEPILAGMPWLFSCYCLISGCMRGVFQVNCQMRSRNQSGKI